MSNAKPFLRLLWKDWRTVRPLAVAMVVFTIAANVLVWGLDRVFAEELASFAFAVWIWAPNLAALGAPAMLVGSESDSRTFDWLRTLPPGWRRVADAKLVTATGLYLGVWLLASGLLWLQSMTPVGDSFPTWRDPQAIAAAVGFSLYFGGLLLLCGFVTAYSLRSPVSAILALVPLITVATLLSHYVAESLPHAVGGVAHAGLGMVALLAVGAAQRLAARYRLHADELSLGERLAGSVRSATTSRLLAAYRPPTRTTCWRPSPTYGLLWQHFRQIGGAAIAIVASGIFVLMAFCLSWVASEGRSTFTEVVTGLVLWGICPLLSLWLGCLVFTSDSHPGRREFLAEHGVTPTAVWWTRLVVPVFWLMVLVAAAGLTFRTQGFWPGRPATTAGSVMILMLIAFAFGGLVSMWVRRPTLAFFAAPAYAAVASVGLSFLFATDLYPEYRVHALWVVPVLSFATWRLMGRWLERRVDRTFDLRVVAYTALAVGMPAFVVFGHRWATTPDAIPRWRESMVTVELPKLSDVHSADEWRRLRRRVISSERDFPSISGPEELLAALDTELTSDEPFVGQLAITQLRRGTQARLLHAGPSVAPPPGGWSDGRRSYQAMSAMVSEINSKKVDVMLRWAGELRRRGAAGEVPLSFVFAADQLEESAVTRLSEWIDDDSFGIDRETIERLAKRIPDRSLRRESRRVTLIGDWQRFREEPWLESGAINPEKDFAGLRLTDRMGTRVWLSIERRRTERFVDHLVRHWIDVLDANLRTLDDPERHRQVPPSIRDRVVIMTDDRAECGRLYRGAIRGWPHQRPWGLTVGLGAFSHWTPEHERRIETLRNRVGL